MIDPDTQVCISIAGKPGTFGARFHNTVYQALDLNYVYIPRRVGVGNGELAGAIVGVRALMIKGCSVSMPHKESVMQYLDRIDPTARGIGAVNTIVRQHGALWGYNTDYSGAKRALSESLDINCKPVLILGAGGVARAIGVAVQHLGGELTIANRTFERGKNLAELVAGEAIPWADRLSAGGYLLVNATSVGMADEDVSPVPENMIERFDVAYDVVQGPTMFAKIARQREKKVIPGKVMCVYQAVDQVHLYTGHETPKEVVEAFLAENP